MATIVNIHEAKTHFSKLAQRAAAGEDIVIAKAGKPFVRLTTLAPERKKKKNSWLGCLAGEDYAIPDDFNTMGQAEIEAMFYGEDYGKRRKG